MAIISIKRISKFRKKVKELETDTTFGAGQNPFPSIDRDILMNILNQGDISRLQAQPAHKNIV